MKFLPKSITRSVGSAKLLTMKNSPGLLFGAGIVGVIGSTVLACRATLKLEELVDTVQNDLEIAKNMDHKEYSDRDRQKDIAIIYARGATELVKMYGPAVLIGSVSIGMLTKSHNILTERNAALAAAYAAVDKAFNQYRERVTQKFGPDMDHEFRFPKEEYETINSETGKLEIQRVVADSSAPSMYARFFDPLSPSWSKDPEYNLVFLRCQQNYANDMLKTRGHVFLNEVYDMLGIERTKAGAVVGWVVSEDGDNYIDFGLYADNDRARDFVNGREGSILLDFNVDGVIYDKIDQNKERLSWQS